MVEAVSAHRIYVVDDSAPLREAIGVLLETAGYRVETFASPDAFLGTVDRNSRGCVLLDVRLPGMDGLAVQQALAERGVSLPVVLMTGYGDVPMAVEAMRAGAVDFLEKPIKDDQLLAALDRALAAGPVLRTDAGSAAAARDRLGSLTPREREVLGLIVAGRSNKEAARALGISSRTVEIHRRRVLEKMQAGSLAELVRVALFAGVGPAAD